MFAHVLIKDSFWTWSSLRYFTLTPLEKLNEIQIDTDDFVVDLVDSTSIRNYFEHTHLV